MMRMWVSSKSCFMIFSDPILDLDCKDSILLLDPNNFKKQGIIKSYYSIVELIIVKCQTSFVGVPGYSFDVICYFSARAWIIQIDSITHQC